MDSKFYFILMGTISLIHLACQHSSSAPDQPVDDKPTGGVIFRGNSASFNATRVFGPTVNVSRRSDGSWGGFLLDQAFDVNVRQDSIIGAYLKFKVEQLPDGVVVNGLWGERLMRFEVGANQILIRTPAHSITLTKSGEGTYGTGGGEIKLTGEAAQSHPPEPQFAIALLATFGRGSGR